MHREKLPLCMSLLLDKLELEVRLHGIALLCLPQCDYHTTAA